MSDDTAPLSLEVPPESGATSPAPAQASYSAEPKARPVLKNMFASRGESGSAPAPTAPRKDYSRENTLKEAESSKGKEQEKTGAAKSTSKANTTAPSDLGGNPEVDDGCVDFFAGQSCPALESRCEVERWTDEFAMLDNDKGQRQKAKKKAPASTTAPPSTTPKQQHADRRLVRQQQLDKRAADRRGQLNPK